jgi:hypothetical protein
MLEGAGHGKIGWMALEFVKDAARRGIELTEKSMNITMRACAKEIEINNTILIMEYMDMQDIKIDYISFLLLLRAKKHKGYSPERTFNSMAKHGLHPSVSGYEAAGKDTEALALYDSLGPDTRIKHDHVSALYSASEIRDAGRVEAILREMERANIPIDETRVRIACSVFQEVLGKSRRKNVSLKEMEAERPCIDTIVRIIRANGLCVLNESLVQTLLDHGRRHDAEALAEHWISRRDYQKNEERHSLMAYVTAMDALGMLYSWPIVIYLFEEAIFKARGETRFGKFLFVTTARNLEQEERDAAEDESNHCTRRFLRTIALQAYRLAVAKGWTSHSHTHGPWTIDVHRYSSYTSLLAVEMVLEKLAADLLEGSTKEIEDLEVITGRGVHSAVSEEGQHNQGILRKKLADVLLREDLLSFTDVSAIYKQSGGTIIIKKEKIKAWIRRYNWDQKQQQRKELLLD